jgi:hypothetical protein
MTALPPAPTASGRTLLTRYREDVVKLDDSTTEYRADARVFPAEGVAAVRELAGLAVVTFPGFTGYLKGHADLQAAHRQAKEC